jgi:hypothetical protein
MNSYQSNATAPICESAKGVVDVSILDLSVGIHRSVPPTVYHERHLGLVSRSALEQMQRSAAHYKAWVDGTVEDEETPALIFGAAFHCAMLEPQRYETDYAVEPSFGDCRKTANKEARDAWRREHAGATWLPIEDARAITGMVKAVHSHPLASKMVRDGEPELTVRWQDDETGLPCKARSDYYVERLGMVADFKSSLDASPEAFRKEIVKRRYHRQYAFYRDGFAAVGAAAAHFVFVVVEKSPPYAIGIYTLDEQGVALGHSQVHALMRDMRDCLDKKAWPGFPATIRTLDLPPWAA